jgi:hypothetical protein
VEFNANTGDGGYGVAVFETGKILGEDSSCVYVGSYEIKNGLLVAEIEVPNDRKTLNSFFGDMDKFRLRGKAQINEAYRFKDVEMIGEMVGNTAYKIRVKFTRRAELP